MPNINILNIRILNIRVFNIRKAINKMCKKLLRIPLLSEKFWKRPGPFVATRHIFSVLRTLQSREFTEVAEIAERVKKWFVESEIYRFQLHILIF